MLYTIGSLVLGAISTAVTVWLKYRSENILREKYAKLEQDHANLVKEYNNLVANANAQVKTLQEERDTLLNALEKSGRPGVFADLLRKRNTGHQDPE